MILVDSSVWIEYFVDSAPARLDGYLKDARQILTPTVVVYEVYKKLKRDLSEQEATEAVAQILKTRIVPLSEEMALSAADASLQYGLPMADSIVFATALEHDCQLVTMDADFKGLPQVILLDKH